MRLNIGCGPLRIEGEIGVDLYPTTGCDVRGDMLALPFRGDSVECVRLDHVLEHLPYAQVVPAVLEAVRVLQAGGKLRIGAPDLVATCQAYLATDSLWERGALVRQFYGRQSHEGEYHKSGWDEATLSDLMVSCGLANVETRQDKEKDYWGASLIAEGVKP